MADLIEKEKIVRAYAGTVAGRVFRHAVPWCILAAAAALSYAGYAISGLYASAQTSGELRGIAVHEPAAILRDERGIPHIRARDEHDAFFAEGFAQASDRLFQMDLFRRYVYGQLSEIVGPIQLGSDEKMRAFDVRDIVDREWKYLPLNDRRVLQSYSDGVNAAMSREPLPIEFRLLLYEPRPWTPRDSLAVTLAIAVTLGDTPQNVIERDALWRSLSPAQYAQFLPLSDEAYDVTAAADRSTGPSRQAALAWSAPRRFRLSGLGSNAWAAAGRRTVSGDALIANDPHLSVSIPGLFYAVEMRAPGLHVAGVTIPGIPGVILGHNERFAWASTNAMVAGVSVFAPGVLRARNWKTEIFSVRFHADVAVRYYRTATAFGFFDGWDEPPVLVRWAPYSDRRSALTTVLALDRARDLRDALAALARYSGPPQNFILADTSGRIAYHLAGPVANDRSWGRYVHPAADLSRTYQAIPFDRLPAVPPSRSSILVSANNKMYGAGYRYRLSAMFAPPYRAYRIAALLHARRRYDAAYFARMQLDTVSPAEAEFARRLARYARTHTDVLPHAAIAKLATWDGTFAPRSQSATLAHDLRSAAESASITPYGVFGALRRAEPPEEIVDAVRDPFLNASRLQPWARAGAVPVFHPFGAIGFPFLNGGLFPGDGDEYTIHVQTPELAQSFRAVWEVGKWDRGGLSIPSGESGEIGSAHYDDLSAAWIRGLLMPLPFSDRAVSRALHEKLVLFPN